MAPPVALPPPVIVECKLKKPSEYSAEYRVAHAEIIKEKRVKKYAKDSHELLRQKILWQLNRGLVTRPTAKSIETYLLFQDASSGLWRSREVLTGEHV